MIWLADLQKFKDYRAPLDNFISQDYVSVYEDTSLQKIIDTIDYNISGVIPVLSHKGRAAGLSDKSILRPLSANSTRRLRPRAKGAV